MLSNFTKKQAGVRLVCISLTVLQNLTRCCRKKNFFKQKNIYSSPLEVKFGYTSHVVNLLGSISAYYHIEDSKKTLQETQRNLFDSN